MPLPVTCTQHQGFWAFLRKAKRLGSGTSSQHLPVGVSVHGLGLEVRDFLVLRSETEEHL